MKAIFMLEDGKSFTGESVKGLQGERIGKVIFDTAVVGYQEKMTDPANAGKILVLTYPLIGNYGTAPKFNETDKVWISGLVIKEKTRIYSNWQAKESIDDFIEKNKTLTITEIDTRTLSVHLRQKGEMLGIISTNCFDKKELLSKIDGFKRQSVNSLLSDISVKKPVHPGKAKKGGKKIAVLDLGITNSILKQLHGMGFDITLMPYNSKAQDILRLKAKGLIISNGPEDDKGLAEVIANVKPLIGKMPTLGISTGHQVLAQSLGAKLEDLKAGHHGSNYPIRNPASFKGEITVQNHSKVVTVESLSKIKSVKISEFNLNDRTVEEIESQKLKIIGVQYLPVSPGFDEINSVFHRFAKMLERRN